MLKNRRINQRYRRMLRLKEKKEWQRRENYITDEEREWKIPPGPPRKSFSEHTDLTPYNASKIIRENDPEGDGVEYK